MIILIIDLLYVHIRLGLNLGSVQFLKPLLESYGSYLIPLEAIIVLIIVICTYIDGKRQVHSRTTFILALLLEQTLPR